MTRTLDSQVVVIVGASSGIGRASALRFGAAGASVVCAARNAEALDAVVGEISAAGGTAVAVPTDVADWNQVLALAEAAVDRFDRIDTWVNAAAVSIYGTVEQMTPAEVDRVMQVNFMGHVHGVYAALPRLRNSGGGTIIGISSVLGARAVPLQAPYVASKWAIRGFLDALRMELECDGAPIAVTTILPSSIDTPFFLNARSKLGRQPQPVPPVYAPEVVAAAITRAAVRPTREVPVGGAGVGLMLGQRLAPALTDKLMTTGGLMFRLQQDDDRADDGRDAVDSPVPGRGSVRGNWSGHVARSSAFTTLAGQRPLVTRAMNAVAAAAVVRRLARTAR